MVLTSGCKCFDQQQATGAWLGVPEFPYPSFVVIEIGSCETSEGTDVYTGCRPRLATTLADYERQ
jgi:hypothetical protein